LRLLLDEMCGPTIAELLRERGHDVESVSERADLRSAPDGVFDAAQEERRVIVTNNVRDFMPLVQYTLQRNLTCHGIVFTSDRSLPRSKKNIGAYTDLLHALLTRYLDDERLPTVIAWLPKQRRPATPT
jgi:Domain of unknown function (DUF5615)